MQHKKNIFLIGLMGAGKTTIGRQLARELHQDFIDSDHEIEARTGVTIPHIFDVEGEDGFRRRESSVIDELSLRNGIVLATGGGAILREENRQYLKSRGTVFYLYADLETLFKRTSKDRNRPLLQAEDPKAVLASLLEKRDPLYRETADFIIDTSEGSIQHAVKQILTDLSATKASQ